MCRVNVLTRLVCYNTYACLVTLSSWMRFDSSHWGQQAPNAQQQPQHLLPCSAGALTVGLYVYHQLVIESEGLCKIQGIAYLAAYQAQHQWCICNSSPSSSMYKEKMKASYT